MWWKTLGRIHCLRPSLFTARVTQATPILYRLDIRMTPHTPLSFEALISFASEVDSKGWLCHQRQRHALLFTVSCRLASSTRTRYRRQAHDCKTERADIDQKYGSYRRECVHAPDRMTSSRTMGRAVVKGQRLAVAKRTEWLMTTSCPQAVQMMEI